METNGENNQQGSGFHKQMFAQDIEYQLVRTDK